MRVPFRSLLVLAVTAAVTVPSAAAGQAPPPNDRTPLSVTGVGIVEARPDRAEVTYVVQRLARTRNAARGAVARRSRLVLRRLRSIGIDPLSIRLSEVDVSRRSARRKLEKPFIASATVAARTQRVGLAGRMLDLGPRAGVDTRGPEYELIDDLAAREQATTKAVNAARRRAEAVARGLGRAIVGIRSISLDGSSGGGFDSQLGSVPESTAGAGGPSIPTAPGTIRVEASVTVVFELAPSGG